MNCNENIRIEGEFSGTLIVDGFLRVGKNGRVNAEIKANIIAIEGEIVGNVTAKEKVHLYPTGQLKGDVHCPRTGLSIDPGALFEGRSVMHDELDYIISKKREQKTQKTEKETEPETNKNNKKGKKS